MEEQLKLIRKNLKKGGVNYEKELYKREEKIKEIYNYILKETTKFCKDHPHKLVECNVEIIYSPIVRGFVPNRVPEDIKRLSVLPPTTYEIAVDTIKKYKDTLAELFFLDKDFLNKGRL